jgi:SAM-dependent methyltransferase
LLNTVRAIFRRPEKGWDPVDPSYAEQYADKEWKKVDHGVIDRIEGWVGGLAGKRVLDLGGGPGQYSVAFAQRGAEVTWHDVSRSYLRIAQRRAEDEGVHVEFSLGYMEEARKFVDRPFDLVFNRICWYYAMNDAAFADLFFALVKPGGAGYIDVESADAREKPGKKKIIYFVNDRFWLKLGNPLPPHGRIARLMLNRPIESMVVDYSFGNNDRILFKKSRDANATAR